MESFYIDKIGNEEIANEEKQNTFKSENDDDEDEFINTEEIDLFDKLLDKFEYNEDKPKKSAFSFDDTYLITNYKNFNKGENVSLKVNKVLEKAQIKPGLEKCHSIPSGKSNKALKLERKKLREQTKGEKWFNIPATEVTEEIKTDFQVLKMRSVFDRKHVYKKNDITKMPKYFQVGKVIESSADFYSGRIPKSQRKKTIVDELLADAKFKKEQKKKFKEIMDENRRRKRTKKNLTEKQKQKMKLKK